MIFFVTLQARTTSIETLLAHEGRALQSRMRVLPYEELCRASHLPFGTYVFAAVDRLTPAERQLATLAAQDLTAAGGVVLNQPDRVKLRYDLLTTLYAAGMNRFRPWPAAWFVPGRVDRRAAAVSTPAFPVFVREANDHGGNLTPLIHDRPTLIRELLGLVLRGFALEELLVVEFCDTADLNGSYRKYSAFVLGDRVLPRYLNMSRAWMVKHDSRIYELSCAREELEYLLGNAHDPWLRQVFALAGIQYGRIDYGVLDGQPQAWEINTSPTIGPRNRDRQRPPEVERYRAIIAPGRERFYRDFVAAWEAVDSAAGPDIPFAPASGLRRQAIAERTSAERRAERRRARKRHARPWARLFGRSLKPAAMRIAPLLLRIVRS